MFYAFVMKPMGEIDLIQAFPTEELADEFGKEESSYSELDPVMDNPDHWEKYDPPVVILFEAGDHEVISNGKYKRPVAIYERGEKYICVKSSTIDLP